MSVYSALSGLRAVMEMGHWKVGEHYSGALAFIYTKPKTRRKPAESRSETVASALATDLVAVCRVMAMLTQRGHWWSADEKSFIARKTFAVRELMLKIGHENLWCRCVR